MFSNSITYPIRGNGWIMILAGAIFSVLLGFLQMVPIFGFAVALFSAGYFSAFYLDVISTTMTDQDEVPDWPSFSNFADDIVVPFVRIVGLVLLSFGPIIALGIFGNHKAAWFLPATIGAGMYGCLYFPMAVLATQAFGNLGGALPHIVIPAILRAGFLYLFSVIGLAIGIAVCAAVQSVTESIPFVGWLLTAGVAIYSLMFQARLIGLFYREKREALGWE